MSVQNSLTKSKSNQRFGITAYLTQDAVKQQINNVIGGKDGQRFISAIVSAVNTNPALQECTNQSILSRHRRSLAIIIWSHSMTGKKER